MNEVSHKKDVVVTCTTCFRWGFGVQDFLNNFLTFIQLNRGELNRIDKFVIVNEFSSDSAAKVGEYRAALSEALEKVVFIQKEEHEKGQAQSLVILSNYLKGYKYHVHWEEGWCCNRKFFTDALKVMDDSDLSQLTFQTCQWDYPGRRTEDVGVSGVDVKLIYQHNDIDMSLLQELSEPKPVKLMAYQLKRFNFDHWPLFTLRPSINRLSFTGMLPAFRTEEKLWPVMFELLYSIQWTLAGGTQAALLPPPCSYSKNHKSTYPPRALALGL